MKNNYLSNTEIPQDFLKELSEIQDWYVLYERKDVIKNTFFLTKNEILEYYHKNKENEILEDLDTTLFNMTMNNEGSLVDVDYCEYEETRILNKKGEYDEKKKDTYDNEE